MNIFTEYREEHVWIYRDDDEVRLCGVTTGFDGCADVFARPGDADAARLADTLRAWLNEVVS